MVKPARQPAYCGILIPDLMVAFNSTFNNVTVSPEERLTPCGVILQAASRESKAPRGNWSQAIGQQVRQLRARVILAAFPSGKPCHFWKGVNGELKRGVPRRGDRDHRKPTATTNLGNLGIRSGRALH